MITFNDCFYNSENKKGFIETFDNVDSDKLVELLGEYDTTDIKRYDIYIKSKIGFLNISPLIETINREYDTTLEDKQSEIIKMFLMLHYKELLKVKNILLSDISVNNGIVKSEDKNTVTTSKNSVSAFNSIEMEDDTENNYNNETSNVITEKRTDTDTAIKNINLLTDFYKQSMIDKIIEYAKNLFTLQVVD